MLLSRDNMDVTSVAGIQREQAHSTLVRCATSTVQSALCDSAIAAKCKYGENRRLPAEALDGGWVMDAGLLGAHLDVEALIIEDHHPHMVALRPHVENKRVLHHQPSTKCSGPYRLTHIHNGRVWVCFNSDVRKE